MPKLVYLDSSDFSVLSEPDDILTAEDKILRDELLKRKRAGAATFILSPAHVSECLHAHIRYREESTRRAMLMRDLNDSTTRYVIPIEICRCEIHNAIYGKNPRGADFHLSKSNEWFGLNLNSNFSDSRINPKDAIKKYLGHLSRKKRRILESQLDLRKRSSHTHWRSLFKENVRMKPTTFPFTLINQDLFIEWFLGNIGDDILHSSLVSILNDIPALFAHLLDLTEERESVYGLLRNNSMVSNLATVTEKLFPNLEAIAQYDLLSEARSQLVQIFLSAEIERAAISAFAEIDTYNFSEDEFEAILTKCPGLKVFTTTLRRWIIGIIDANIASAKSGRGSPKKPKASDYGDMMHCIYTPYVDVFRADRSFAGILKEQPAIRSRIIETRAKLLAAIDA